MASPILAVVDSVPLVLIHFVGVNAQVLMGLGGLRDPGVQGERRAGHGSSSWGCR